MLTSLKTFGDNFLINLTVQVDRDDGVKYYDSKDENRCNWMMFVRPAQNWSEQNLIVYQFGLDIYFATIKPIEPKQELKVKGTE